MPQDINKEAADKACSLCAGNGLSLTQAMILSLMLYAPNNKMYMMAHLEPSVALTGGRWYTDNELDTEFIKLLSTACLRFIQDNVSRVIIS